MTNGKQALAHDRATDTPLYDCTNLVRLDLGLNRGQFLFQQLPLVQIRIRRAQP